MGQERDHAGHGIGRSAQAGEDRVFRCRERSTALRTDESLMLTRMDAKVPLAYLASGWAVQIGAAYSGGVHARPPRYVGT